MTLRRIAPLAIVFVGALAFRPAAAAAQGPPAGGGAANNLQAAVEALAARVTALEAGLSAESTDRATADMAIGGRVAKLESGQIDASDLVGTYAAVILQLGLATHTVSGVTVRPETASGTFTLSGTPTPCTDEEATTPCFSATISGSNAFCEVFPVFPAVNLGWRTSCSAPEVFENAPAEWRVDADGSLVVQVGGEDVINDPNFIGAGGRVIISAGTVGRPGGAGLPQNGEAFSVFMVLTRMPNP